MKHFKVFFLAVSVFLALAPTGGGGKKINSEQHTSHKKKIQTEKERINKVKAKDHWNTLKRLKDIFKGKKSGGLVLNEKYWKEAVDINHQHIDLLETLEKVYEISTLRKSHTFHMWLKTPEGVKSRAEFLKKNPGAKAKPLALFNAQQKKKSQISFLKFNHPSPYLVLGNWEQGYSSLPNGEVIFVISPDKKMYVSPMTAKDAEFLRFHHSSFLSNAAIFSAGMLTLLNSRVHKITNYSGHYEPGLQETLNMLQFFKTKGMWLQNIRFSYEGKTIFKEYASSKDLLSQLEQIISSGKPLTEENLKAP